MRDNIESLNDCFTFVRETYVNDELDDKATFEFYNKNNVVEVLESMVQFLQGAGYTYIDKLVAVKADGEEVHSDESVEMHLNEILEVLADIAGDTKTKKINPNLEVVVNNDNVTKLNNNSDNDNSD